MMKILSSQDVERLSEELPELIRRGIIQVKMSDVIVRNETQEYINLSELESSYISISEGAQRYNVPQPTISRWAKNPRIIRRRGKVGKEVFISERDLAYCAGVYKDRPGAGRWLFNPDGTLYYYKKE